MKRLSTIFNQTSQKIRGITVVFASLALVLAFQTSAMATATMTGFFTMLSAGGPAMRNTSEPYFSSSYKGFHTPVSGTITSNGDGTFSATIGTFDFFDGSLPAEAKSISIFGPGSYTFNNEVFEVDTGFLGAKMLFDWNGTANIDVVLQIDGSGNGMAAFPDTHWSGLITDNDGPFTLASTDDDGDGITGHPMWNGPFNGSNANFDFNIAGITSLDGLTDSDSDKVLDDGSLSGTVGDAKCISGAIADCDDNCIDDANPGQEDCDDDGIGDVCEANSDTDTIPDDCDNCPNDSNPGQEDLDEDGIGDVCDDDIDGDGVLNVDDNCPVNANSGQEDCDGDGTGDVCDTFNDPDFCLDTDEDGIADSVDNCPLVYNPGQENYDELLPDGDSLGDACDSDMDADTALNEDDCAPKNENIYPGATELCNGIDDDCDLVADEDFTTLGDACTNGFGVCEESGVLVCTADGSGVECNAIPGEPTEETDVICNGLDDDCDNDIDEDYVVDDTCGVGACQTNNTPSSCGDGVETPCVPGDPSLEANAEGTCADGIDNDCDDLTDGDDVTCFDIPPRDAEMLGIFTMISSAGAIMENTDGAGDNPWMGHHTEIAGLLVRTGESAYDLNIKFLDPFFGNTPDYFPEAYGLNGRGTPVQITDMGDGTFQGHLFFYWNGTVDIDVLAEWNTTGTQLPAWDPDPMGHSYLTSFNPSFNGNRDVTWDFSMTDDNIMDPANPEFGGPDGISGHPMWNGPFNGSNADFDFNLNSDDEDRDGYTKALDCNDQDYTIYPGAKDICGDGVDQDCDFRLCPEDTPDLDGDGYISISCDEAETEVDPVTGDTLLDIFPDFLNICGDCDDSNVATYPGATEICDGEDNNCDGVIDDGLNSPVVCYTDDDNDTFGDKNDSGSDWCSEEACNNNDLVANNLDCNDDDSFIQPNGIEICDGIDNDCDNLIDLEDGLQPFTYYMDTDEDGFGNPDLSAEFCEVVPQEGWVVNSGDCSGCLEGDLCGESMDDNDEISPNGIEDCADNIDENCDGTLECVVTMSPGRYIFDINTDLPNIRAGGAGKAGLKSYFAFVLANKFRAVSTYPDIDNKLNSGLPGNSAGLISFELLEEPISIFHEGRNEIGQPSGEAEEVMANILVQGMPRSVDSEGNFVYPGDYKIGIFTSPGGDYIHYIESLKAGKYDPAQNSLEFFLSIFDPLTGEKLDDSFADTETAGKRIIFPYDPIGTESYQNFGPELVAGGCSVSDAVKESVSGTRVSYNGKIFLYGGVASHVSEKQADTNGDGVIDATDDLIDANEDGAINGNDIPDDIDGDGVVSADEEGDDRVDSWKATLATAANIPENVPGFACIAFVHVYDGVIFPAQNAPPTAVAGEDVVADVGQKVTLDGTGSYDPDEGDSIVSYSWDLLSWPVASSAVLINRDSATPSITIDVPGGYVASLVVTDSKGTTSLNVETVTITVTDEIGGEAFGDDDADEIPNWDDVCPDDRAVTCKDSDRDGVLDSEEYAPNDPAMTLVTEGECAIDLRVGSGLGGSDGGNKAKFRHVQSLDTEGIPDLPPNSVLLSYDVDVSHPSLYKADGAEVSVTIEIPCGIKKPKIFKLVDGEVKTLHELGIPYRVDTMGSNTITVTLKDGSWPGDQDKTVNGIIIDPIGIGEDDSPAGGGGGGGGGCAISNNPDAADAALLLLPLFFYGVRWARKRIKK